MVARFSVVNAFFTFFSPNHTNKKTVLALNRYFANIFISQNGFYFKYTNFFHTPIDNLDYRVLVSKKLTLADRWTKSISELFYKKGIEDYINMKGSQKYVFNYDSIFQLE